MEKFRHPTPGCPNLYIQVNHKPLVSLFNNKSICDIDNPKLLALRRLLLRWEFKTIHLPGVLHKIPDAASRRPVGRDQFLCAELSGALEGCPWPGAAGEGTLGLINVLQVSPLLMQKREGFSNLRDDLNELAKSVVFDIIISGGLVVTTP